MFKRILLFLLIPYSLFAQNPIPRIATPSSFGWNKTAEGDTLNFQLRILPDSISLDYKFEIQQGKILGMDLDSTGHFTWVPDYHLVSRVEEKKLFQIIVEARDNMENRVTANIDIEVEHTNRAPVITGLKTFYIQFNQNNVYSMTRDMVYDEDRDPLVYIPNLETFPEGMSMSNQGEITWKPSLNQFKMLQTEPLYVEFMVQDQPHKATTNGRVKLEVTQMDLPPQITVVPNKKHHKINENETINLRFYLSDPNGEEDIQDFDFVTNIYDFPKNTLSKISNTQYEFIWTPGYDFVQDPKDTLSFFIDFFAIDMTQNREVLRLDFTVKNTINEVELDLKNYNLYFNMLVDAWELMEQLKEKEEELKKEYLRARKGKRNRSVLTASLGATTGLSSVVAKGSTDTQKAISAIGGTTTLTISTLEATEVIGRSMKDVVDRLNYVVEKKNEIQTKGDIFARDFSLKAVRRGGDFVKKIDEFNKSMSLKGMVALELSATWENQKKPTESNIKKTFKDFVEW